jgi:rubrerythrin
MDSPAVDGARLIRLANHLIEVDLAAIAAYRAALRRLSNGGARRVFETHLSDHERHVDALSELVARLGGMPPAEGDFMSFVSRGKVLFGNFAGDMGIVAAMRSNEQTPLVAYEQALDSADLSPEARALVRRHALDEERHCGLISTELERLPKFTLASMCEAV